MAQIFMVSITDYKIGSFSDISFEHKILSHGWNCLQEWQHFYNWNRLHGSLGGLSLMEKYCLVCDKTPFWDDVEANNDDNEERLQGQNYRKELRCQCTVL